MPLGDEPKLAKEDHFCCLGDCGTRGGTFACGTWA